jgi:transposase
LDAISLVNEQGYNNAEASRNLGISPSLLGKWIRKSEKDDVLVFRGNGKLTPEQSEIRQLKEEN